MIMMNLRPFSVQHLVETDTPIGTIKQAVTHGIETRLATIGLLVVGNISTRRTMMTIIHHQRPWIPQVPTGLLWDSVRLAH